MSPPSLIELPFGLPGRIYRAQMPFSARDPQGENFTRFQELGLSTIVLLAETEECLARSGYDLPAFYAEHGLDVIHLPTPDFSVPAPDEMALAVDAALERAWAGQHLAVHCLAGYGRTGTFLACMARRVFQMDAQAAILWVRKYVPGAVEVAAQIHAVEDFE